jgi:predicted RNase H-like HicB family nuclease
VYQGGFITLRPPMEFHAKVHEEDGSYWAEVEELPGCFASGKDLNELQEALIEAIDMCLTEKEHKQIRAEAKARGMHVGGITVATGPLVPA